MEYLSSQIQECALIPNHTFKLSLYAYIASSMVQHCYLATGKPLGTPSAAHANDIAELVRRAPLPKERIDEYIAEAETLVPYLNSFPS